MFIVEWTYWCVILTGFRHNAHVTDPQSGHIRRFCFGLAKNPDEHYQKSKMYNDWNNFHNEPLYALTWTHHLKFGSCINVRSRSLRWNNSCTVSSRMFFSKMSRFEKYSRHSSSLISDKSGSLQNGQVQSLMLRSLIWNELTFCMHMLAISCVDWWGKGWPEL